MQLPSKIERSVQQFGLINRGEKILVAYSGGPDSTALLYIFKRLSLKIGFSLTACYINHKIRSRAALKEIRHCAEVCRTLKIDFIAAEIDVPEYARKMGLSIEEAARDARYILLDEIAKEERCNKIALGHHQDDVIETILFRLFRGTGPQGLDPIKSKNGKYIRPLLDSNREEIEAYLRSKQYRYLIDRSNLKSEYSRNYIRNKIIPLVRSHFGDKYRKAIQQFAEIVLHQDQFILKMAQSKWNQLVRYTPGGKILLDLNKLMVYDDALKNRVLKMAMEKLVGRIGAGTSKQIAQINKVMSGNKMALALKAGCGVYRERDTLVFCPPNIRLKDRAIPVGKKVRVDEFSLTILTQIIPIGKSQMGLQKSGLKVNIDYDKICFPLKIKGFYPGDRFAPLGMKGTKKVGDFLTDWKIPRFMRNEIPVLADSEKIIWVAGYQIDERVRIDKETRKVLEIEIISYKGKRYLQV